MMTFKHLHQKCNGGYKFTKSQEKITQLMYMDNIKQFAKNLRERRNPVKTKLYSRNFIKRINTWAVLLVRYLGPFLKWTREEL